MKALSLLCGIVVIAAAPDTRAAVLQQQTAGVFAFEAENDVTLTAGPTGSNFSVITTTSGVKLLPNGTNAIGGALYATRAGGAEDGFATYQLAFTSNGTYNLYARYSFFEISTIENYGNEDSYYSPTAFNQVATTGGTWNTEFLPTVDYHPTNKPNEGTAFLWDKGASTYTITGASEATPVVVSFTIRVREPGAAIDRFVLSTTNYTIPASGLNSSLDALVSVPEPGRAVLLVVALGVVMLRRKRQGAESLSV